jgi:uncharacterized membrane protein YeiB
MQNQSLSVPIDQEKKQTSRSLAPDLARGFMLLLIALAHAPMYVPSSGSGILNHPLGGSMLDNIIKFFTLLFIDLRSYPMFAALFGFGLAMIITRRMSKGISLSDTKRLIYRRCLVLILFGVLHAVFVFSYDILTIYGIAGLLISWLLYRSDQTLLRGAAWFTGLIIFFLVCQSVLMAFSGETSSPHGSMAADTFGVSLMNRLMEYPMWIVYSLLIMPLLAPILLGAWGQRKQLLEKPQQNQSFLRKVTIIGISVSMIGGLPFALAGAQVWEPSAEWKGVLISLHTITGMFGGIGYTAMFGLIALRLRNKRGAIIQALASTGKRSLTCYLAQSVLLALLLADWGLGMGSKIHSFGAALIAIFIWLLTVIFAELLERKGKNGPAELLLRHFIYKRT